MDKLYLFLIFGVLALAAGLVIYLLIKKPELLKKYWKYGLGVLGGIVGVLGLGWLVGNIGRRGGSPDLPDHVKEKEKELRDKLGVSRQEMEEELEQARESEQEVKDELDKIEKIDDDAERLQRLADLWNKRRGR